MIEIDNYEQQLVPTEKGMETCRGFFNKKFPFEQGNCFDIKINEDDYRRVLNFNVENFDELKRIGLSDVNVMLLSDRHCVIHDHRIADAWYSSFCSICTPLIFTPTDRQLRGDRQTKLGSLKNHGQVTSFNPNIRPEFDDPNRARLMKGFRLDLEVVTLNDEHDLDIIKKIERVDEDTELYRYYAVDVSNLYIIEITPDMSTSDVIQYFTNINSK